LFENERDGESLDGDLNEDLWELFGGLRFGRFGKASGEACWVFGSLLVLESLSASKALFLYDSNLDLQA
jgi:hypothetical protein